MTDDRGGDGGEDFDNFARTCTRPLLLAAYLLTGDQRLAEDLVQTALCRTYLAWPRLADRDNAYAYARKTMYRLQVDWWRRHHVAEYLTTDIPETHAVDPADAILQRLAVRAALAKLPPKQRAVVTLRFLEGLSEAEVATVLGCSAGTVKSQTFKAVAKLRHLLPGLIDTDSRDMNAQEQEIDHVRPN